MAYYCSNPWTTVFIWGNGDVTHCCYSNFGALGNINRQSLDQIWRGPKLNYIRAKVARAKYIQAGCEHFCRAFRWNKYWLACFIYVYRKIKKRWQRYWDHE